jgi:inner membrane protein
LPSFVTHPAVPLALAVSLGSGRVSRRLLVAGMIASALPDLDVLAFSFGIPYAASLGHRGFSHSVAFAFLLASLGAGLFRWLGSTPLWRFGFLLVSTASHGLLDAFTNGGLGVALFWPWSQQRFFAPFRPIQVSPIGITRFFSPHGLAVLGSELLWVWLPAMAVALVAASLRGRFRGKRRGPVS